MKIVLILAFCSIDLVAQVFSGFGRNKIQYNIEYFNARRMANLLHCLNLDYKYAREKYFTKVARFVVTLISSLFEDSTSFLYCLNLILNY